MQILDTSRYQFIADELYSTGGFAPTVHTNADGTSPVLTGSSYLVRYPRESTEKFARRNQVAWHRAFLRPACLRFAGYLSKKPPIRDITNPLLKKVEDDCDWRGNGIDVFWQQFSVEAKARGSMLLLVDMPKTVPYTLGEQMVSRSVPYFVMIAPERIMEYKLDEQGRLDIVAISDMDENNEPIWRVWTKDQWWIQRPGALGGAGSILSEGAYSIGVCPVLLFTESGDFPYYGEFSAIADLSRRYFNCASERDEILRSQTFSLLTYQVPPEQQGFDAASVAEAIGTNNMLIYQGSDPAFIAPDSGPATVYGEVMENIEENIKRISMTVEQPTQAESGVALTIRFQELNGALTSYARRMEDLERRAWDVVCRWLGIAQQPRVEWSKSFELSDITTELSILQSMQYGAFPPEVIKQQQRTIIGLQYSNADQDTLDEMMAAVDQFSLEPPQPAGDNSNTRGNSNG